MNFYEDFLRNQKKNTQVNNGLADTWQKLKPALPKNAPKAQMQKTEKQTITSSAPKISNAINIFPKGQSFEAPQKPKVLIGIQTMMIRKSRMMKMGIMSMCIGLTTILWNLF